MYRQAVFYLLGCLRSMNELSMQFLLTRTQILDYLAECLVKMDSQQARR